MRASAWASTNPDASVADVGWWWEGTAFWGDARSDGYRSAMSTKPGKARMDWLTNRKLHDVKILNMPAAHSHDVNQGTTDLPRPTPLRRFRPGLRRGSGSG